MTANELKKIVRAPRLSEAVSVALAGKITRGELAPGAQLPTEKMLAASFGVSRAVVREAVARLKADGRIETRQGAGAFVARMPQRLNFRFQQADSAGPALAELHDIFELRAMIETSVAELAARRRSADDIAAMRLHLQAMDDALADGSDGSAADDDFHLAIAAATHNAYTHRLAEFLGAHFSESRRLAWSGPDRARLPIVQAEHYALFEAIVASDPTRAGRCANAHLRASAARVGINLGSDGQSAGSVSGRGAS